MKIVAAEYILSDSAPKRKLTVEQDGVTATGTVVMTEHTLHSQAQGLREDLLCMLEWNKGHV